MTADARVRHLVLCLVAVALPFSRADDCPIRVSSHSQVTLTTFFGNIYPPCMSLLLAANNGSTVVKNVSIDINGSDFAAPFLVSPIVTVDTSVEVLDQIVVHIHDANKQPVSGVFDLSSARIISNSVFRFQNVVEAKLQSLTFIKITSAIIENVTVLIDNIGVTEGSPPVYVTPEALGGLVYLSATSNISHCSVVLARCIVSPTVNVNYALVQLSAGVINASLVHIVNSAISWVTNCSGKRSLGCGRGLLNRTWSDIIYASLENNGLMYNTSFIVEQSSVRSSTLTDNSDSQSGTLRSILRVAGNYYKPNASVLLCSVRVESVSVSIASSETADIVTFTYVMAGLNRSSLVISNVSGTIMAVDDMPRTSGRSVSALSAYYQVAVFSMDALFKNVNLSVTMTPGSSMPSLPCSPTSLGYCLNSLATVDIAQFGDIVDSCIRCVSVSLSSSLRNGIIAGAQVILPFPTLIPFAIVGSALLSFSRSVQNVAVNVSGSTHVARLSNISLGRVDPIVLTGAASVACGLVLFGGNITGLMLNISLSNQHTTLSNDVFASTPSSTVVLTLRQTSLVSFNGTCILCEPLMKLIGTNTLSNGGLSVDQMLQMFPAGLTKLQDSRVFVEHSNMILEMAGGTLVDSRSTFVLPAALAGVALACMSATVSSAVLPHLTFSVVRGGTSSIVDVMLGVDGVILDGFALEDASLLYRLENLASSRFMPMAIHVGCNLVNGVPFPSAATSKYLPAVVQQQLSLNGSLDNSTRMNFVVDATLGRIPGCSELKGPLPTSAVPSALAQLSLPSAAPPVAAVIGAIDAPLLMGILSSKCGGASESLGQAFLSPFYALGPAASVWGNIGLLVMLACIRLWASSPKQTAAVMTLPSQLKQSSQSTARVLSFPLPLCPDLRFPSWDIVVILFFMQGTAFYSTRAATDSDSTTADRIAGCAGAVFIIGCLMCYKDLHVHALQRNGFAFVYYRRRIRERTRSDLWRLFTPVGQWGPRASRLSLGALRSTFPVANRVKSSASDAVTNALPIVVSLVAQVLMGVDFRDNKTSCGATFLALSVVYVGVALFYCFVARTRSKLIGIVLGVCYTTQALLLASFSVALLAETASAIAHARDVAAGATYVVSVSSALKMVITVATTIWERKIQAPLTDGAGDAPANPALRIADVIHNLRNLDLLPKVTMPLGGPPQRRWKHTTQDLQLEQLIRHICSFTSVSPQGDGGLPLLCRH